MDKQDVKEKLLLFGITAGIFFPVRMLFSTYISDYWLGSLGLASVICILFIFLIKKNKLGRLGKIFEKQMRKTIGGRAGKYIIAFAIMFLIYFGASIFLLDRGNSVYYNDKEILFSAFQNNHQLNLENISIQQLEGPVSLGTDIVVFVWISNLEYMLSISLALMDDISDGWLANLVVIVFVEQLEVLGILYFFRIKYKPNIQIKTL